MKFQRIPKLDLKRIVLKLGSLAVTRSTGGVHKEQLRAFAKDIAELVQKKVQVVVVTSGAINTGKQYLKDTQKDIHFSQAAAAIGQTILMHEYREIFQSFGFECAQILLTHEDLKDKTRSLNLKNTIELLLEKNIIPILNENDSVSFAEISFGDNDQLASGVTELISADCLILFTESGGLYNKNPKEPDALLLNHVPYQEDFKKIKIFAKTGAGKGGMDTKLMAIRKLSPQGIHVLLSGYQTEHPIFQVLNSEQSGSYFEPLKMKQNNVKMLSLLKSGCFIKIDDGAELALYKNASLLPVGIKGIQGQFKRGDVIAIKKSNQVIAYGFVEYDSRFLAKIIGKKTDQIFELFPKLPSKVVVHKNNLLLKKEIL